MKAPLALIVAQQELKVALRHRWAMVFAFLFSGLALTISYFGLAPAGYVQFQGLERTSASLLNLGIYVVPLVAIAMGSLTLTGERGSSELLYAQPVGRTTILLGNLMGLFGALGLALISAFGIAGGIIGWHTGAYGLGMFAGVAGIILLLMMVFLALAGLLSSVSSHRSRSFSLAILVWFFFLVVYDFVVIGSVLLFKGPAAERLLFVATLANPIDLARIAGLEVLGGSATFGPAGATFVRFLGGPAMSALVISVCLLIWIAVPLALAVRAVTRRDI